MERFLGENLNRKKLRKNSTSHIAFFFLDGTLLEDVAKLRSSMIQHFGQISLKASHFKMGENEGYKGKTQENPREKLGGLHEKKRMHRV